MPYRSLCYNELLGILNDFLRIVYRKEDETVRDLLKRGQIAARGFDDELRK